MRIDPTRFRTSLFEISLSGKAVPFDDLASHAAISEINFPYRALVIDRVL